MHVGAWVGALPLPARGSALGAARLRGGLRRGEAEPRPEGLAPIEVRKGRLRDGHVEEGAQRTPAVADVVDQQQLGGDRVDHLLAVAREDLERIVAVREAAREEPLPNRPLDRLEHGRRGTRRTRAYEPARRMEARVAALIPSVRLADTKDHLRLRPRGEDLTVVASAQPVDRGAPSLERLAPVDLLAVGESFPVRRRGAVGRAQRFERVQAGTSTELVERNLQRHGARTAESCADDLQRRTSWVGVVSMPEKARYPRRRRARRRRAPGRSRPSTAQATSEKGTESGDETDRRGHAAHRHADAEGGP